MSICHRLICHEVVVFSSWSWREKLYNKSVLIEYINFLIRYVCTLAEAEHTKGSKNKGKAWSKFCFKTILNKTLAVSFAGQWEEPVYYSSLVTSKEVRELTVTASGKKGENKIWARQNGRQSKPSFDVIFSINAFSITELSVTASGRKGESKIWTSQNGWQCKPSFDVIFSISLFGFGCLERISKHTIKTQWQEICTCN